MTITDHTELARCVAARQAAGERIVFTNGVFDLLHVGHLRYLTEARALGDALLVAVNTDASVRALKGDARPLVPDTERAEMLDGLRCVDYVTLFATRTPVALIEQVRPLVYAKGGDYQLNDLPEAAIVQAYGGTARVLSLTPGRSSSRLIEKMRACGPERSVPGA